MVVCMYVHTNRYWSVVLPWGTAHPAHLEWAPLKKICIFNWYSVSFNQPFKDNLCLVIILLGTYLNDVYKTEVFFLEILKNPGLFLKWKLSESEGNILFACWFLKLFGLSVIIDVLEKLDSGAMEEQLPWY